MSARRGLTPAEKRRIRQVAANRRIGHRWAYWIELGPYAARLVVVVAAVGALMYLWVAVPHLYLGSAALVAAALVGGGWLVYSGSHTALQRRMNARAGAGGDPRGAGLGWAVGALVALLGVTGWVSLWSPWA